MRSIDPGTANLAVADVCIETGALLRFWVLGGMVGVNACRKLCEHMSSLTPRLPEVVIIERQSKKSGVMLAVQCWAQAWYVSRGVRVHPVPALMKSAVLTGAGHPVGTYRERKKSAVLVAQDRIPPELAAQWRGLKKKDDVGDTLVTALAWLQKTRKGFRL